MIDKREFGASRLAPRGTGSTAAALGQDVEVAAVVSLSLLLNRPGKLLPTRGPTRGEALQP
eukprot:2807362-Heterocapsa_arctica.AAC.1